MTNTSSADSAQSSPPAHKPYVPPHLRNRTKDSGGDSFSNVNGAVSGSGLSNNDTFSSPFTGNNNKSQNEGHGSDMNGVASRDSGYAKNNYRQYNDNNNNSSFYRDCDDERDRGSRFSLERVRKDDNRCDRDRRDERYDRDRKDDRDRRDDRDRKDGRDRRDDNNRFDRFRRDDRLDNKRDDNRNDRSNDNGNVGRFSDRWRLDEDNDKKDSKVVASSNGGVVVSMGRTNITTSNNTSNNNNMNSNMTGWENRDGRRYYKEQEEDVFPAITKSTGVNFDSYDSIPVEMSGKGADTIPPIESFQATQGVHPLLMNNVKRVKYERPTPVQKHSIPAILARRDLMACAQTGSGKTAAFLFPILTNMLLDNPPRLPSNAKQFMMKQPSYPVCLVLSPTRELAVQIYEEARKFQYGTGIRTVALYGGSDVHTQLRDLDKGCDVCVATPGRLTDLIDRKKVRLVLVKYLVLDEADRMLDMGFSPQITSIIQDNDMPTSKDGRQTVMFSATFPKEIQHMARDFLDDYLYLAVGRVGSTNEFICQRLMYADEDQKPKYLTKLLREQDKGLTIIFVETKKKADLIEDFLISDDFPAVSIHGDRSQVEREKALKLFKTGERPILVATDVAARGLDIQNIMHVINCDLPTNIDDYVHRIGRTGRAGNLGVATSFVNEENRQILRKLLELLHESNQEIPGWFQSLVMSTSSASNNRSSGNDFSSRGGGNGKYGGSFGSRDMRSAGETYTFSHSGRTGGGNNANSGGRLGNTSKSYTSSDVSTGRRKATDIQSMGFPKDDAW